MASEAANVRSTCGFERRAPESSTQRFPAATPHVGQGTEDNCLGVSSFFFIRTGYVKTWRKTIQLGTLGNSLGTTYPRMRSFRQSVCSVARPGDGVRGVRGCLCFAVLRRVFCCLTAYLLWTSVFSRHPVTRPDLYRTFIEHTRSYRLWPHQRTILCCIELRDAMTL
jgi:hypothetical protein